MPNINVYVADDLKARMDAVDPAPKWSRIATAAFDDHCAQREARARIEEDDDMEAVIERLRLSKMESLKDDRENAWEDGREWARTEARYDWLMRLSRYEVLGEADDRNVLLQAIDPTMEQVEWQEVAEICFGNAAVSDGYVSGFIEGAQDLFEEIRDRI